VGLEGGGGGCEWPGAGLISITAINFILNHTGFLIPTGSGNLHAPCPIEIERFLFS